MIYRRTEPGHEAFLAPRSISTRCGDPRTPFVVNCTAAVRSCVSGGQNWDEPHDRVLHWFSVIHRSAQAEQVEPSVTSNLMPLRRSTGSTPGHALASRLHRTPWRSASGAATETSGYRDVSLAPAATETEAASGARGGSSPRLASVTHRRMRWQAPQGFRTADQGCQNS